MEITKETKLSDLLGQYEGAPDHKIWNEDESIEWDLTEPEALYDFITTESKKGFANATESRSAGRGSERRINS